MSTPYPFHTPLQVTSNGKVLCLVFDSADADWAKDNSNVTVLSEPEHTKVNDYPSNSFEQIVSISHVPFSDAFFANLLRILIPGGFLTVSVSGTRPYTDARLALEFIYARYKCAQGAAP